MENIAVSIATFTKKKLKSEKTSGEREKKTDGH